MIGGGVAYAFALAVVVIVVAGYYTTPGLLVMQVALIAGPTALPFALLSLARADWQVSGAITLVLLLAAGWGYVAYVDMGPDRGGGASLAVVLGWMTCAAVATLTLVALLVDSARSAARNSRWPRRT